MVVTIFDPVTVVVVTMIGEFGYFDFNFFIRGKLATLSPTDTACIKMPDSEKFGALNMPKRSKKRCLYTGFLTLLINSFNIIKGKAKCIKIL